MATIPPMTSISSYYITYFRVLLKVRIILTIHLVSGLVGRWTGRIPNNSLRPFETIVVPSTKSKRSIRVSAYRTKAAMEPNAGPVAVHLNWHASGFVLYTFGMSVPFISHLLSHPLLEQYPLVILDCDYAKAPECPFPAATDDARDVLDYVFSHPEIYDLSKVTLGGTSAGGNIALGTSVTVGKEAREGKSFGAHSLSQGEPIQHPIKAVVVFYPCTEWDSRPNSLPPPGVVAPGISLPKGLSDTFETAYFFPPGPLSAEEDAKRKQDQLENPLITPRWADPRDFPTSMGLISCEYDPLTVETENLRAELMKRGTGNSVSGWMVEGVQHGWENFVKPGQVGFEAKKGSWDLAAEIISKAGGVETAE